MYILLVLPYILIQYLTDIFGSYVLSTPVSDCCNILTPPLSSQFYDICLDVPLSAFLFLPHFIFTASRLEPFDSV
jgi:hypothetical protein